LDRTDRTVDASSAHSSRTDKRTLLQLAKNALKKLRALRHPDILKFLDGVETDSAVYIVTESVVSLCTRIGREGDIKPTSTSAVATGTGDEWRIWGLSKVVNALGFINDSGASTHGNLRLASVFVTPSGEWKLAGFEVLSSPKDAQPILYVGLSRRVLEGIRREAPTDSRWLSARCQQVCFARMPQVGLRRTQGVCFAARIPPQLTSSAGSTCMH
jgi:hypothetical protein